MGAATLAFLHAFPVKSTHAVDLDQATVEPWGLRGDRRWLLLDRHDAYVSQLDAPTLSRVTANPHPEHDGLLVRAPGMDPLPIRVPSLLHGARPGRANVRGRICEVLTAGDDADDWFSRYVGRPVRLVHQDNPERPPIAAGPGGPARQTSHTMSYPIQLITVGSLGALNQWIVGTGNPIVSLDRFRANLVVDGTRAWAEDTWQRVRVGAVSFTVRTACVRCRVTAIDQETAEAGREPLVTLARHRRFGRELRFGLFLVPDQVGVIRVGDPVEPLPG